jgi:MAPEG family
MASTVLKSAALAFGGSFWEAKYGPAANTDGPMGLSTYAGFTALIFTLMSGWSVAYGFFVVNKARSKAIEQAKKDGEKDVDDRYGLPNLYAQGTSKPAKAFNCVQRSHQHFMETFPPAAIAAAVASIHYPLAAALNALVYAVGRVAASRGYANNPDDPSQRYAGPFAFYFWHGLIANVLLAALSSANMIAGKKLLW